MTDINDTKQKSGDRIAKTIARAGLASRREAEAWIAAGRVAVNGTVINSPAMNVTAHDRVTVDGAALPARERTRLFLYHKPRGLMTTHADPENRPTIFSRLPKHLPRLISVGRLDFNTEGLLLLTNDGALARALELPATGWLRRYRVRAHGSVTQEQLDELRAGVTIEGIRYGSAEAAIERVQGSNLWLTFAIREGKNREVRNVLGHLGLAVTRLIRVSFGPFQLAEITEGAVEEVPTRVLREQLGARVIALAKADFSSPKAPSPPQIRPAPSSPPAATTHGLIPKTIPRSDTAVDNPRQKKPDRKPGSHAWRARDENGSPKKLKRKFRGSRRDNPTPRGAPAGERRAAVLTDRKGRDVPVERFGHAPRPEPTKKEHKPGDKKETRKRGQQRHRFSADRASGPRPRQPRDRR